MKTEAGIGLAALSLLVASCTPPGPRGQGRAEVFETGDTVATWSGACLYRVQTRWATALPHIIRLDDDHSERALVISRPRRWAAGQMEFRRQDERGILGLAMDGSVVEGPLQGSIHVTQSGDSTFVEIRGAVTGRTPSPLTAFCRLGPPPS